MSYLERLEKFMAVYSGSTVKLNPPATLVQLEAAETSMGVTLPNDVRAAYLRFNGVAREHANQFGPPRGPALFLYSYDWVDLSQMVELWHIIKKLDSDFKADGTWPDVPDDEMGGSGSSIRPVYWHSKWIPVGSNGTFNTVYLDLAPAQAGTCGQLVFVGTGIDSYVLANSFESYITRLLDAYDRGQLIVNGEGSWRTADGALGQRLPSISG